MAGSRGGAPRRCPQTAKSPYFKKTEQGVRNAKAFRGEAYKTASPFNRPKPIRPPKRSGGTFWTKQLPQAFCTVCTRPISFSTDWGTGLPSRFSFARKIGTGNPSPTETLLNQYRQNYDAKRIFLQSRRTFFQKPLAFFFDMRYNISAIGLQCTKTR